MPPPASLRQRRALAERLKREHPGHSPVIVTFDPRGGLQELPKRKLLVPDDFSVFQLHQIIRRQITVPPETALYLYVGNTFPSSRETVGVLYASHQFHDGFLYLTVAAESTFGASVPHIERPTRDDHARAHTETPCEEESEHV